MKCVIKYILKTALIFFPCLSLWLSDYLLKCCKVWCHLKMYLLKEGSLVFGLRRWCLLLILIFCIDKFVWKISWLMAMKFTNDRMYWHAIDRMSGCLNIFLNELLDCAPAIIMRISFCIVKISPILQDLVLIWNLFLGTFIHIYYEQ